MREDQAFIEIADGQGSKHGENNPNHEYNDTERDVP